jgi:hypothetical protein
MRAFAKARSGVTLGLEEHRNYLSLLSKVYQKSSVINPDRSSITYWTGRLYCRQVATNHYRC